MTNKDFKAGIKAELKSAGFTDNKLNTIVHGVETVIFFMQDVLPESPLAVWLQDRFKWGVTICKNGVQINTPKQNNKIPKPTQGEWEIADNGIEDKHKYTILSNGSKCICDIYRKNYPKKKSEKDPEALANAQRIVKAVNMHDKLVTALRVLYTAYMREDVLENVSNGEEKDMQGEIEHLLKQAEQK